MDLSLCSHENTPPFDLDGIDTHARVMDVHDGDTLKVFMPITWAGDVVRLVTLRLKGVNTPEVVGDTARAGFEARDVVLQWLSPTLFGSPPFCPKHVRKTLEDHVILVRVQCGKPDKYGRTLAKVHKTDCLNDVLIARGWTYPISTPQTPRQPSAAFPNA